MATILLNRAGIRGALPPDHPEYKRLGITKADADELSITKAMAAVADPDEAVDLVEQNIYGRAVEAMGPGETVEKAYYRVLDALPDLYTAHDVAKRRQIAKRNGRPF